MVGQETASDNSPLLPGRLTGLALLALALAAVLAGSWALYRLEAGRILDQQRQREAVRVSLLTELLRSELRPAVNDVRLLADGDGLRGYLDTGSRLNLQSAIRRARFVSLSHPDYDQIRFIDQDGNEVLRVNQGGDVVPAVELQNKVNSPYFQRASALPPGSIYISDFDLTIDNGQVVQPLKPVLRFAVPVFDSAGKRRGIYVISRLGTNLIGRLQQAAATYSHRLRLLDSSGQWVKAGDPAWEWSSALPERTLHSLARSNPALWARIQQEENGESGDARGLFNWQRLVPESIAPSVEGQLVSENAYLVVASEVPREELATMTAAPRHVIYVVVPGLLLLVLLSAWLIRQRGSVLAELRAMNQVLEHRVRERTVELARSYEELREREALLEETGHLAKVGGWEFDPVTGAGTWTPEIAHIHDLDPTLKPSRDMGLQFFPGESRARLEKALQLAQQNGTAYDLELEFVSAAGVHKWVRTISRPVVQDGRVVRVRGALQDITKRKHTELRLQAQLQRMHLLERTTRAIGERQDLASILHVVIRTLEERLPLDFGCVCLYDATDRKLTVAAVGAASGPLAEQIAMAEQARIPIDENGLSRCVAGNLVYEADVAAVDFPFPRRLAAGGLRALVAAPLQIESQVFGVLIAARRQPDSFGSGDCEFLRQLSEHVALAAHQAQLHDALKAAYEDLRNTQQAIMQQERLRVLGQMSSGIAHDINNAISPIMLYTDSLIEKEPGLSERARQSLRTIQQAVSDVAETVARMREFYRPREAQHELQAVQLNTIALQLRDLTRARWEAMPQQQGIVVDLQLDLADKLPPALGIESEVREALINLIFNAVDAMPAGGRLVIRTRPAAREHVSVEVIDSGIGMDEETRRRCLEPFFTTKGERGTGLGLAMVYGVMQRLGGEVEIDSAPDAGTTVRLSFAVAATQAGPSTEAEVAVPTGLHILLVDDDPILLRSLRETLELDGQHIQVADGGQAGINAFRSSLQTGGPISVVITDLGMPHVDGRAVASAVKQAAPGTPVIMLTGWGERLLTEGHTVPHVDRVLSKPPRLRDVRRALADLLGERTDKPVSG
jgi:signal transduction histidine kinase/ActR/RegA family two-component response regulator/PAS domain-containing protein